MPLLSSSLQPVPEGAVSGFVDTPDGVRLRHARFEATAPFRGTVVLLHGRTEFIEKYYEVIGELRGRGFAVATFDWRGQGLSSRLLKSPTLGHVRRFSDYLTDLDTMMRQVILPECRPPFFALTHSMGGAILMEALHQNRNWFERSVLSAPMLDLSMVKIGPGLRALSAVLCAVGLGGFPVPGGTKKPFALDPFETNLLTHDAERYARASAFVREHELLGLAAPTNRWMNEAMGQMLRFRDPEYARHTGAPMLIVAAGADPVVSTPFLNTFASALPNGKTVVVPGAKHEVMMEDTLYREQFWAAFDAFVPGEKPWG